MTVTMVPVSEILVDTNDRKVFDVPALEALAASIERHGWVQPISLRKVGHELHLVAGERRLRAHKMLGRETIPAIVDEMTDETASAVMLMENTGRVNLNVIEEARAYQRRMESHGLTVEQVAEWAGVTAHLVRFRTKMLALDPAVIAAIESGILTPGFAECLCKVTDRNLQVQALRKLGQTPMDFFTFNDLCNTLAQAPQDGLFDDLDSFLQNENWTPETATPKVVSRKKLNELAAKLLAELDGETLPPAAREAAELLRCAVASAS